ncbi:threonine aldolase family protein [Gorillibacterium sp. sgz5001074]|uniref:threonine aldolase family protein n=1 Tax=Gorillibacterium sp. sgz5001074 TaxID=3446695 RepID=UPI003F67491F
MEQTTALQEAWKAARFPLSGHGKRNVRVLTEAFREMDGLTDSDMYGKGEVIEAFQTKMAAVLGKEAAVFFPSGTMAQQIALRLWCDLKELRRVAYHPLCHLEIHEEDGLKRLHHLEPVLLAQADRLITLEDVQNMGDGIACLLLELPQREIGGQLPDYGTLKAISAYCREKGIALHLDGARLFEVLPYYKKTAAEVCALFDSVYISFYKGIGGIAGAILAGEEAFVRESSVWKRRHGGDLISLYPYIVSADYYYDLRVGRMERYYEQAVELAAWFNGCHEAVRTLPAVPVSNMFHVHFARPKEQMEPLLAGIAAATGVAFTARLKELEGACSFELSIGDQYGAAPKEAVAEAFRLLGQGLAAV